MKNKKKIRNNLSVIIAAKNNEDIIENTLKSVTWVNETIVIIANDSTDNTKKISEKYTLKIFITNNHLGFQRSYGISRAKNNWILILDSDEIISKILKDEIIKVIGDEDACVGYKIPYYNYFLNHKVKWGNQKYCKLRLFNKKFSKVEDLQVHPKIKVKGLIGELENKLHHYSFRSIPQIVKKFTYYASVEAPLLYDRGVRTTLKHLIMYPAHMFWSVFVKDQGYRDGIWGFGLALSFTYYELMRYVLLLKLTISKRF